MMEAGGVSAVTSPAAPSRRTMRLDRVFWSHFSPNLGPGGWVVELPTWLKVLVYANPVSYLLDLLRLVTLGFSQLPLAADLLVALAFPPVAMLLAARAIVGLRSARA